MDKNDIIWWPDDRKGLMVETAITARDRASWRFLASRAAKMVLPTLLVVAWFSWRTPDSGQDAFLRVRSGFEWGLLILPPVGLFVSLAAIVLLISEWWQDRKHAGASRRMKYRALESISRHWIATRIVKGIAAAGQTRRDLCRWRHCSCALRQASADGAECSPDDANCIMLPSVIS